MCVGLEARLRKVNSLLSVMLPPSSQAGGTFDELEVSKQSSTNSQRGRNSTTGGNMFLNSSLMHASKQYERRGVASVLFVDIDDFDMLVFKLQSQQLLAVLDAFFSHADQICERYGLITIETVGKEYMATSKIQDSLNSSRHIHGAAAAVVAG